LVNTSLIEKFIPVSNFFFPHIYVHYRDSIAHNHSQLCDLSSNRSASHILINDCRDTPRRCASLSNESTIQDGKSTFTRLGFLVNLDQAKEPAPL